MAAIKKVTTCIAAVILGIALNKDILAQQPSIEAYALDPSISDMALSPNGEMIAYTTWAGGARGLVVQKIGASKPLQVLNLTENKLRGYEFLDNKYLLIYRSETVTFNNYLGEYEYWSALALNLETGNNAMLLGNRSNTRDLSWPQLSLDDVLGPAEEEGHVLMAADSPGRRGENTLSLFSVDLETGRGYLVERGERETYRIFVGPEDKIHGRLDYSNFEQSQSIWAVSDNGWEQISQRNNVSSPNLSFTGFSPNRDSLVFMRHDSEGFDVGFNMDLDTGDADANIFAKPNTDISATITHWHQQILGVRYAGLKPDYQFYDDQLNDHIQALVKSYPDSSVRVIDITEDLQKVLVLVQGNYSAGSYFLSEWNGSEASLTSLGSMYPNIPPSELGYIYTMDIEARDGLEIPVLLTIPPGIERPENLPAIMMPHGGPFSHDRVGFHYEAQYFANRGYLVMQPNFRGSSGFGREFSLAGRGEWGGKMQDDLTDVVLGLSKSGVIDPDRVCIMGGSYGGYAALAGGAFNPDLYQCVVAIAPVSDLPRMLNEEESGRGGGHWVVDYWDSQINGRGEDRDDIAAQISPVNFAENFTAPVLLVHGDDDTVVPIRQSRVMETALERADKEVELVRLREDDHYLSYQETRLQALTAISEFIDKHMPAN